jgi:hypothetical protein
MFVYVLRKLFPYEDDEFPVTQIQTFQGFRTSRRHRAQLHTGLQILVASEAAIRTNQSERSKKKQFLEPYTMKGPVWVLAGCLCVAIALVVLPQGDRQGPIYLEEVAEADDSPESRIAKLKEESQDKAIEAAIRKAAAELEQDRADSLKNKAMAEDIKGEAMEDKQEAVSYFEKAKTLADESERSKATAKVAEQQVLAAPPFELIAYVRA